MRGISLSSPSLWEHTVTRGYPKIALTISFIKRDGLKTILYQREGVCPPRVKLVDDTTKEELGN